MYLNIYIYATETSKWLLQKLGMIALETLVILVVPPLTLGN